MQTPTRVSLANDGTEANAAAYYGSISANGQYVVFASAATNLVSDDTNGVEDVFLHDRVSATTSRVSVASDGTQANDGSQSASISSDDSYIAFSSSASNLVSDDTNGVADIFVRSRLAGTTVRVNVAASRATATPPLRRSPQMAVS